MRQYREPLEEYGSKVVEHPYEDHVILEDPETGCRELYMLNDSFAGHVVVIDGNGYRFIRNIRRAR